LRHTGAGDDYQEVFLPGMQFSETALTASIAENVADIYQDMKDLVMSFRTLDELVMEQALAESQQNFVNFWGQKLVNCLRALHHLIYTDTYENTDSVGYRKNIENLETKNQKPGWLNERFTGNEE